MEPLELQLPRLVGSRETVRALLADLGPLHGHPVVLNARQLRSAAPSAADEFVKCALVDGGALAMEVVGAGPEFTQDLETAAADHNVSTRLRQLSAS